MSEIIPQAPKFCDYKTKEEIENNTKKELEKLQLQIASNPDLLLPKNIYKKDNDYEKNIHKNDYEKSNRKHKGISSDQVLNDRLSESNRYLKLDLNNRNIEIEELKNKIKILENNYRIDKDILNYIIKTIQYINEPEINTDMDISSVAIKYAKLNEDYLKIKKLPPPPDYIEKFFSSRIENKNKMIIENFNKYHKPVQMEVKVEKDKKGSIYEDVIILTIISSIIYYLFKKLFG